MPEFYEDLLVLYGKLCQKETVFLFTDGHVKEESFLEAINNMLTIGLIPAIFAAEEARAEMIQAIGPLAKKSHIIDTP
jgi:dynein heavy chain